MDMKRLVLGAIVALIAMFALAGIWHAVLLDDFYHKGMEELNLQKPSPMYVAIAYIVLVVLMAIMYPIGYKGGKGWLEGLRFGILIGLVWILPATLLYGPVIQESFAVGLVDVLWHIVEQGVGGLLLGLIASSGSASETVT